MCKFPGDVKADFLDDRPRTQGLPCDVASARRVLDPVDRNSEVLFGLIMVLTFTCTLSAGADDTEVRTLVVAAIGCNAAWGLVDGVMFVTMGLIERAHGSRNLRTIRAATPDAAREAIADSFPPFVARAFDGNDLDWLSQQIAELPDPPAPTLNRADWLGAVGVVLLVFGSTFPVVIPLMLIDDATSALRASNAVALVMLFGCGTALGRHAGIRPYRTGMAMAALGVVLVAITIALGG
jgi:hypothetical protein